MRAINYTTLRENMKTYMDKVSDDYETMIVTRKNNKNVVMLSEESYNNLIENAYIMGNKANYDWLMESKAQLKTAFCSSVLRLKKAQWLKTLFLCRIQLLATAQKSTV